MYMYVALQFDRLKAVHTFLDNMFRSISRHVQCKDTVRKNSTQLYRSVNMKPALLKQLRRHQRFAKNQAAKMQNFGVISVVNSAGFMSTGL